MAAGTDHDEEVGNALARATSNRADDEAAAKSIDHELVPAAALYSAMIVIRGEVDVVPTPGQMQAAIERALGVATLGPNKQVTADVSVVRIQ